MVAYEAMIGRLVVEAVRTGQYL